MNFILDNSNLLTLFLCLVPLPVIFLASREKRIKRGAYFLRLIAVILAMAVLGLLAGIIGVAIGAAAEDMGATVFLSIFGLVLVPGLVLQVMLIRWVLYRLTDCGWKRWTALALCLPLVNMGFAFVVSLPGTRAPKMEPEAAAA